MLNKVLDFLFPKTCLGCGQNGSYFCQNCQGKTPPVQIFVCPICERPSLHGFTHFKCQSKYSLDGFLYGFDYKNPLRQAITKVKLKQYIFAATEELVAMLLKNLYLRRELDIWLKNRSNTIFVPVPLHWFRLKERGFNQSEILAQNLSKNLGIPTQNLLERTVLTPSQRGLSAQKRKENVSGIFSVIENCKLKIGNSSTTVLVVDDVWTTGSTLKSCGKVLKEAGFKKVFALTLAR